MQFSVYKNKNPQTKGTYPYLIDIQSDLLRDLRTRVVIPVTKQAVLGKKSLKHLMPVIEINSEKFIMLTPQLAGVTVHELGTPVGSVVQYRTEIIAALDFLITGI